MTSLPQEAADYTPEPPIHGNPSLLRMRWEELTALHWDVDPNVVAALLPRGLEPDIIEGRAWVGLIPFRMAGIRLTLPSSLKLPLPWSTFPETNVRTYVRGPDGERGVYFHSLDVPFFAPTVVARLGFRLPYCTATMGLARRRDTVSALAVRRWPSPRGRAPIRSRMRVEVGDPLDPSRLAPLDVALSAQWRLYTDDARGGLLRVDVHHAPWVLHSARVLTLDDGLVQAAGYPAVRRPPTLVRWARPVDVLVGLPRRVP